MCAAWDCRSRSSCADLRGDLQYTSLYEVSKPPEPVSWDSSPGRQHGGSVVKRLESWRVALGCIVTALLIGAVGDNLNRTIVEMPAWRTLGATAWAAFSRLADLGNGRIIYPVAGIGSMVLVLAAAISFRTSAQRPWSVAIPVYGAALMNLGVILLTTQAAPIMLRVPRLGTDPVALQQAFEGFYRWDSIRAVVGALASCAQIWAVVALLANARAPQRVGERHPAAAGAIDPR
jgi:hypothetical protein